MISGPAEDGQRPNPDALLRRVLAEERGQRGQLKIFFGASAGVGKTYAMLKSACALKEQGVDIVVGLVETHGRQETAALLQGLDILARRKIRYRDRDLEEFDLDEALRRKPQVILVDELAHTNLPGSRHSKRWNDIEELLAAGVDVHTTLNVQHLESLNDVVGSITGVRVRETVPDRFFDSADEIVLVDLPADDLLKRLAEGKVYLEEQAQKAVQSFFRKGNLIALREMALRRTADRVNDEVHTYRRETGRDKIWQTRERVLACVGPAPGSDQVLRSAGRLAGSLNADWHAVYIETPLLQQASDAIQGQIAARLKLAQDLGSSTATLTGVNVADVLVDYARKHNVTKIVLGRTKRSGVFQRWRTDLPARVAFLAPDIEIVLVSQGDSKPQTVAQRTSTSGKFLLGYVAAGLSCGILSLCLLPARDHVALPNIAMLYLLGVLLVSSRSGRGPALAASVLNVLAFDVLFVPPRMSLTVHDAEYLITFVVMLAVGIITAHLTAGLRFQARVAAAREQRIQEFYEVARRLSAALTLEQICEVSEKSVQSLFQIHSTLLIPDRTDKLQPEPSATVSGLDFGLAQWAFDHASPAGAGTHTLPGASAFYYPLKAPMRVRGLLVLGSAKPLLPEQERHLETLAALLAIALERIHFVAVAQESLVTMEAERLRESLLAALSHDLRTPLTSLHGIAQTLAQQSGEFTKDQKEAVEALAAQAAHLVRMVNNLLSLARLESGRMPLHRDWLALEEIVGTSRENLTGVLASHSVQVNIPPDFPLVYGDAVLLERVVVNLLENAAKYASGDAHIEITAEEKSPMIELRVADRGRGLTTGAEQHIFEKFFRGDVESNTPGAGLGLAICRAIVTAHQGSITVEPRIGGGTTFTLRLPKVDVPEPSPPPLAEWEKA